MVLTKQESIVQEDTSLKIPEHITSALELLSPEQRQQVFDLIALLSSHTANKIHPVSKPQRTFGQYHGRISMSADFDEPL
jgi:hypothetical protein